MTRKVKIWIFWKKVNLMKSLKQTSFKRTESYPKNSFSSKIRIQIFYSHGKTTKKSKIIKIRKKTKIFKFKIFVS